MNLCLRLNLIVDIGVIEITVGVMDVFLLEVGEIRNGPSKISWIGKRGKKLNELVERVEDARSSYS